MSRAITHFTNAIEIDPNNVLYSNRSACYCGLRKYEQALEDAECCIGAKPDWGKGYGRKGAALHGLGRYNDAISAYEVRCTVGTGRRAKDEANGSTQHAPWTQSAMLHTPHSDLPTPHC